MKPTKANQAKTLGKRKSARNRQLRPDVVAEMVRVTNIACTSRGQRMRMAAIELGMLFRKHLSSPEIIDLLFQPGEAHGKRAP